MKVLVGICVAFMLMKGICLAQAPGRAIAGTVRDPSGDIISGAQIRAVSRGTGQARTTTSGEHGECSFQALPSGDYAVIVECAPFQRTVRGRSSKRAVRQ